MTKSEAGQWVTSATNVAVLLGAVLLVIELRQNEELARLEMIQSRTTAFQQAELAFLDPEITRVWVKSIKDPATMTLEEARVMVAYLAIHMTQLMRIYDLEQAGLLREGTTMRDFTGDFEYLFGNRFGKAWFEEFGQDWPSDFVELARPVVESVDENGLKKRFSRLLKSLQTE